MAPPKGPPAVGCSSRGRVMSLVTCLDCGISADRSGGVALRCLPCALRSRPRIAAPGRVRNGTFKPLKLDGRWVCLDCHAPVQPEQKTGPRRRPSLRCSGCRLNRHQANKQIRSTAGQVVARAVAAGHLPKAATRKCADCGEPASVYDHRDYTQPLKVEPVCRSCNVMRGPAEVWSSAQAVA